MTNFKKCDKLISLLKGTSNVIIIQLTQNKTALIDDCDLEFAGYAWQYDQHTGYAKRKFTVDGKRVTKYLHRLIYEKHHHVTLLKDELVDHRNNNRLDCQLSNLRLANHSQNSCNRPSSGNKTGFKGVYQVGLQFEARVCYEGVTHKTEKYPTAELAFIARMTKAQEIQGGFAHD